MAIDNSARKSYQERARQFVATNKLLLAVGLVGLIASFTGFYAFSSTQNSTVASVRCEVAACISLSKDLSEPQVITVTAGSFVQFNSADGEKHNVALVHSGVQHEDHHRYESGDFKSDEAWKVQFKKDGTYTFADKYNKNIEVSVVVYTPGKDYKIN